MNSTTNVTAVLDDKTRNRLLELGMSVLSVSGIPDKCMKTVVPNALSQGLNNTLISFIKRQTCIGCSTSQIQSYLQQLDSVLHSEVFCPKNRGRDKQFQLVIRDLTWTVVSLATLMVVMRIATKKWALKKVNWDDWALASAMVLTLVYAGTVATGTLRHKTCKRVWTVTWTQYKDNLRHLHNMELLYTFVSWVTHGAIMAFYWNILPRERSSRNSPFRFFHKSIIFAAVIICATHIVSVFTIAYQCMPVFYWRAPMDAVCLPRVQIWAITSTATVLSDILLLSLPIRVVWKIKVGLSIKEKLSVTGMFLLGIFACLTAIVRAIYTSRFLNDVDWTFSQCYATPLTVLEPSLAIIAACVPSLRILAQKGFPKTANLIRRLSIPKPDKEQSDGNPGDGVQRDGVSMAELPQPVDSNTRDTRDIIVIRVEVPDPTRNPTDIV